MRSAKKERYSPLDSPPLEDSTQHGHGWTVPEPFAPVPTRRPADTKTGQRMNPTLTRTYTVDGALMPASTPLQSVPSRRSSDGETWDTRNLFNRIKIQALADDSLQKKVSCRKMSSTGTPENSYHPFAYLAGTPFALVSIR